MESEKLKAALAKRSMSKSDWMTVKEAAAYLGMSKGGIQGATCNGWLPSVKVEGRLFVKRERVEFMRDQRAKRKAGVPASVRLVQPPEEREPTRDEILAEQRAQGVPMFEVQRRCWVDREADDVWVTTDQAARVLNLHPSMITRMAGKGKIRRRWARPKTNKEIPDPTPTPPHLHTSSLPHQPKQKCGFQHRAMYSLRDIQRIASDRDRKSWERTSSPNDPERPLRRPIYRKFDDVPPNDKLITTAEAASMLSVSRQNISDLVRRGRLFAWQREPGKQGSRLYLSVNQVWRLAHNPNRQAAVEQWQRTRNNKGKRTVSARPVNHNKEGRAFCEDHGLAEETGRALQKDHGEYYTTSQSAKVLCTSVSAINTKRKRGVLKGYRSPNTRVKYNRKRYWFFKKDDVDALKLNHDHQRRRKIYLRWRYPEIYGEEAQQATFEEPGGIYPPPHTVNLNPSPARKMILEMEGW